MTIERVKQILNELAAMTDTPIIVPVTVNGRLTTTLGRVKHTVLKATSYVTPVAIEFSREFLETASDESVLSVVKHEFAHYYVTMQTHENHGHDATFKAFCRRIGCDNDGVSTEVERVVEVKSKYEVFCSCCGKRVGTFSRSCKTTQNPHMYTSKCCNRSLIVEQNW